MISTTLAMNIFVCSEKIGVHSGMQETIHLMKDCCHVLEIFFNLKVTGDSLLIHAFAYSLLISLCSVTSNMTSYSHSYHSIKLIHCGVPQRDVLSDKMVL